MNRLILLGLAILALAGLAPTHASEVRDSKGRFSLSVPAGWSSQVPENNNEVTVVLAKVDTEAGTGAACLGIYFDMPATRSASQADLNTVVEGQLTETFWRDALKASGDRPVDLVSRGKRDIDGRRIHNVVFTGEVVDGGKKSTGKGKMELHFIPGAMHSLMCITEASAFDGHSAAFELIFTSYVPSTAPIIAMAPSGTASALTLFARTSQTGTAQVVSRDMPDVRGAGFNSKAASVTVDGIGSWLLCSGVRYTGQCAMVSGPAATPFEVLSARRGETQAGPADMAASAFRRALALNGPGAIR